MQNICYVNKIRANMFCIEQCRGTWNLQVRFAVKYSRRNKPIFKNSPVVELFNFTIGLALEQITLDIKLWRINIRIIFDVVFYPYWCWVLCFMLVLHMLYVVSLGVHRKLPIWVYLLIFFFCKILSGTRSTNFIGSC